MKYASRVKYLQARVDFQMKYAVFPRRYSSFSQAEYGLAFFDDISAKTNYGCNLYAELPSPPFTFIQIYDII